MGATKLVDGSLEVEERCVTQPCTSFLTVCNSFNNVQEGKLLGIMVHDIRDTTELQIMGDQLVPGPQVSHQIYNTRRVPDLVSMLGGSTC